MRAETEGRGVFDSIYEANIETIYLTAKRYTRNHHAAEEIAQDTFLKLFRNMEHTNIEAYKAVADSDRKVCGNELEKRYGA